MVDFIPYFAGFITVIFGIGFALAIVKPNKKQK
jgi:hypothetical protein